VSQNELFVTGAAGCRDKWGEYWGRGNFIQTDADIAHTGALGETCVNVTWLHYCNEMLRLSGDPAIPLHFQRTAFNAILGGTDDSALYWVHRNPTPLAAPSHKFQSEDQIGLIFGKPYDNHDCCRAQGPEGLAMLPVMALMQGTCENAPWYMNLYESMETSFFKAVGAYPFGGDALEITFTKDMPHPLCLNMLPYVACVKFNGKDLEFKTGEYLKVADSFTAGQRIEIAFDMSVKAEIRGNLVALSSGPLVLAQDSRLENKELGTPIAFGSPFRGYDFAFRRIEPLPGFRACFQNSAGRIICDYASADSCFSEDVSLQVWHNC